jgi:hypothetical protein
MSHRCGAWPVTPRPDVHTYSHGVQIDADGATVVISRKRGGWRDNGGTAGILRDQAPGPLSGRTGVDALVVSTDNGLT